MTGIAPGNDRQRGRAKGWKLSWETTRTLTIPEPRDPKETSKPRRAARVKRF